MAEIIGISRQSFDRRLNRALESLIESAFMMELGHRSDSPYFEDVKGTLDFDPGLETASGTEDSDAPARE